MTAHLSCSLTHIDSAIQQDGLNLIDSLVSAIPTFIARNYNRILPDCLDQISARRTDDKSKAGVSTDVSENISAIQWRVDVLRRVDKIFEALLVYSSKPACDNKLTTTSNVEFAENLYCEVYPARPEYLSLSDLSMRRGEDPIKGVIDQVLPLVLDSWVEATSAEGKTQRRSFVTNEVFALLESIAGILDKLVSYAQLGDGNLNVLDHLKGKYSADLNSRLLSYLPYSNSMGKCNAVNIKLCNVTLVLATSLEMEDKFSRVLACLGSQATEPLERLKVLRNLLGDSRTLDTENRTTAIDLVLEMYKTLPPGSKARKEAVRLLSELAEDEERLGEWLGSLPTSLASATICQGRELVEETLLLNTILKFAQRKNLQLEKSFNIAASSLEGKRVVIFFIEEKGRRVGCSTRI